MAPIQGEYCYKTKKHAEPVQLVLVHDPMVGSEKICPGCMGIHTEPVADPFEVKAKGSGPSEICDL